MSVHNASAPQYDPLHQRAALLSLMSSLFWSPDTKLASCLPLLLCSGSFFLLSLPFHRSPTNSTYCLPLTHPPLPLAADDSPPSPLLSLFLPRLLSHHQVHVSIMWDCYVAAHSWKPVLSALSFLFYIVSVASLSLRLFDRLFLHIWNHFFYSPLRNKSSGVTINQYSGHQHWRLLARQTQTDNRMLSCVIIC